MDDDELRRIKLAQIGHVAIAITEEEESDEGNSWQVGEFVAPSVHHQVDSYMSKEVQYELEDCDGDRFSHPVEYVIGSGGGGHGKGHHFKDGDSDILNSKVAALYPCKGDAFPDVSNNSDPLKSHDDDDDDSCGRSFKNLPQDDEEQRSVLSSRDSKRNLRLTGQAAPGAVGMKGSTVLGRREAGALTTLSENYSVPEYVSSSEDDDPDAYENRSDTSDTSDFNEDDIQLVPDLVRARSSFMIPRPGLLSRRTSLEVSETSSIRRTSLFRRTSAEGEQSEHGLENLGRANSIRSILSRRGSLESSDHEQGLERGLSRRLSRTIFSFRGLGTELNEEVGEDGENEEEGGNEQTAQRTPSTLSRKRSVRPGSLIGEGGDRNCENGRRRRSSFSRPLRDSPFLIDKVTESEEEGGDCDECVGESSPCCDCGDAENITEVTKTFTSDQFTTINEDDEDDPMTRSHPKRGMGGIFRSWICLLTMIMILLAIAIGGYFLAAPKSADTDDESLEMLSWQHLVDMCAADNRLDLSLLPKRTLDRAVFLHEHLQNNTGDLQPFPVNEFVFLEFLQGCTAPSLALLASALLPSNTGLSVERYVLSVLFFGTQGELWMKRDNWVSSAPVCNWVGVGCSPEGTITELDLDEFPKSSRIPEQLYQLDTLRRLKFGCCVAGELSTSIAKLTNLEEFDISSPDLTGTIPSELGSISLLRSIRIRAKKVAGTVPPELGTKSLESLELHSDFLTGHLPIKMARRATNLVRLEIKAPLVGSISEEWWRLKNLRDICFKGTTLSGEVMLLKSNWESIKISESNHVRGSIPTYIGKQANLTHFIVRQNFLSGTLPTELGLCTNMKVLDLAANEITGSIPSEFGLMSSISKVNLAANFLTGTIPEEISQASRLTDFWAYDKFGSTTFGSSSKKKLTGTVPQSICNLTSLRDFVLSCRSELFATCPESCCRCFG